jgi:hypothetical protein
MLFYPPWKNRQGAILRNLSSSQMCRLWWLKS